MSKYAGICFSFAIASNILGVWNEAATFIPNIETSAPYIIIFEIILLLKTEARTTTSLEVISALGSINIETRTIPKYMAATIPIARGIARGKFFSGFSMSLAPLPILSNPVNA